MAPMPTFPHRFNNTFIQRGDRDKNEQSPRGESTTPTTSIPQNPHSSSFEPMCFCTFYLCPPLVIPPSLCCFSQSGYEVLHLSLGPNLLLPSLPFRRRLRIYLDSQFPSLPPVFPCCLGQPLWCPQIPTFTCDSFILPLLTTTVHLFLPPDLNVEICDAFTYRILLIL